MLDAYSGKFSWDKNFMVLDNINSTIKSTKNLPTKISCYGIYIYIYIFGLPLQLFKNSDGSLVDPDLAVTSDPTTTRDVSPNEEQVEEEQGPVADDSTSSTPTPQDPAMEALSTINILAVQDGEKVIAEKTREASRIDS